MIEVIKSDINSTYQLLEGTTLVKIINCFRAPGVQVLFILRFGQWSMIQPTLIRLFTDPIYFIFNEILKMMWGIEIPRQTQIGAGFYIGHFGGIIISPDTVIGKNCNISQGVTIGISGKGEKRGSPTIGDNVYMAPGAKIFGKIKIGNNVKIGANAVIYKDIPDDAIAIPQSFQLIGEI